MTGRNLTLLCTLIAVALLACAVGGASFVQRQVGHDAVRQTRSAQQLLLGIYDLDLALRGFTLTGDTGRLPGYVNAAAVLDAATDRARRISTGAPAALRAIDAQDRATVQWRRAADVRVRSIQRDPQALRTVDVTTAQIRRTALDRFRSANLRYADLAERRFQARENRASLLVVLVALGLGGLFTLGGWALARRAGRLTDARRAAERAFDERQRELNFGLQVTESEEEAHSFLHRHLEHSIPGSEVVVLERNNSANRLRPGTRLAAGSRLADAFVDAEPRDCLAIRLAQRRSHPADQSDAVLSCGLCGRLETETTCSPLLVGGTVIGSVLVGHPGPLDDHGGRALEESVKQAAPVLANLRNLAIAETRAATDGLTGLPNRRAFEETFKRMAAHANRTMSPLAAVALDLDHFKQVNDVYGHGRGDEVLAEVGVLLATMIRDSDFVARVGGEEFTILLPDTGRDGALIICERIRTAIAALEFPAMGHGVTASLGVAVMPDDEGDAASLVRAADRLLYTAKANGRDRVEIAALDLGVHPDGGVATA